MAAWRGRHRANLFVFICCVLVLGFFHCDVFFPTSRPYTNTPIPNERQGKAPVEVLEVDGVELVVARMTKENVTWLDNYLTDWKKVIYVVDDPKAEHTVPVNKGREAMVFLTYDLSPLDPKCGFPEWERER